VSFSILSSIALTDEHGTNATGAKSTAKTKGRHYIASSASFNRNWTSQRRRQTTYDENRQSEFSEYSIFADCWGS
jgi:hypothetical protein